MATLGFFSLQNIGLPEMLVVLVIGLLLFGKRLPEVGRSLGKGIVEFKRGLKGMADEIEEESNKPTKSESRRSERDYDDDADRGSSRSSLPPSARASSDDDREREPARVSRSDKIED
jgi:TatA/E family protein of Tat protein translocase